MNRFANRLLPGLALLVCLSLTGCGASDPMSKANYEKIKNGMTNAEVGQIFGFKESIQPEEPVLGVFRVQMNHAGVDRETVWEDEETTFDYFKSQELGGVNKKYIEVRYLNGKVEHKDESGLK
jgi:hypothetical protein